MLARIVSGPVAGRNTELDEGRTVTADVRDWLATRTYSAHTYSDVDRLATAKGATTVSVVLPVRNEAATVGAIVECLRTELMHHAPLLDEIVVVDGGSTDDSVEAATAAGARVVDAREVLPTYDDPAGKGDALWKSLAATSGDIVCWVDADITNFHPRFVYGLLGPLLTMPEVQFVKGFYERPLRGAGGIDLSGGGRVTELVARPLINLHWPELAGFAQPLSGEYAGRRTVLEQVPFATGYGVELGLLVDLLDLVGLDGMAQVDLERRVHRHQTDHALARMAMEIQQTALARLERTGRVVLADEPGTVLLQFDATGDQLAMTQTEVRSADRPPMCTVREYCS